jgi:hypothetical protein
MNGQWVDGVLIWSEPPVPEKDEPTRHRLRRAKVMLRNNPGEWAYLLTCNTRGSSALTQAGIRADVGFESRHVRRPRQLDDRVRGVKDAMGELWVYDTYTRFVGIH